MTLPRRLTPQVQTPSRREGSEDRQGRLVTHAELARLLRPFGYSPARVGELLRELPDPADRDRAWQLLLRHGIAIGALMDRMGASP